MKKPSLPKAPPSLEESQIAPSTLERKSPSPTGKGEQFNFPCSPELKKEIKMFCVELGITQTAYLEKMHRLYYTMYKEGKV
ncbi:hypothetical protein MF451_003729 [Salmonella enterica subsp. enterica serovar Saintpaul]|nr:hypothetical protein [Salmonella enterica subsp. enterica serovar Saintpaul]